MNTEIVGFTSMFDLLQNKVRFMDKYAEILGRYNQTSIVVDNRRKHMVYHICTALMIEATEKKCSVQPYLNQVVLHLLKHHEESQCCSGRNCVNVITHHHLGVAMTLSYKFKLKNKSTFIKLLLTMYQCQKTFQGLFLGVFRMETTFCEWRSDWSSNFENLVALKYFCVKANQCGLKFDNYRFMDVPITCYSCSPLKLAARLNQPQHILFILRYGGSVYNNADIENVAKYLVKKVSKQQIRSGYHYTNLLNCLRYLLRAIPSLKLNDLYKNDKVNSRKLVDDGILPANRVGITPPPLEHLARCAVRKCMIQSGTIPKGIKKLNIPDDLKSYINLYKD
ncbi:uncharacterized protein LOC109597598 isoform X2 [Aethina tumida]|nr:uncharacterized protein LOC109597598 isoform X2 [Aethina tumida]